MLKIQKVIIFILMYQGSVVAGGGGSGTENQNCWQSQDSTDLLFGGLKAQYSSTHQASGSLPHAVKMNHEAVTLAVPPLPTQVPQAAPKVGNFPQKSSYFSQATSHGGLHHGH